MTLTELITEVYGITNRPDRIQETLSGVRSATMKVHRLDYFPKDIYETGINFPTSDYTQQIDYRAIIPRFRAMKYLREFDATAFPSPGLAGKFFQMVAPETILDDYFAERKDIWYLAGDVIQVRSCTQFQYALLGCYLNPIVGITDETFSSWIATEFPWAIIHNAASHVFRAIGNAAESQAQMQLASMEMTELTNSNVTSVGY